LHRPRTESPDFPRVQPGNCRSVLPIFAGTDLGHGKKALRYQEDFGAGEGARTLDPDLGKVVLNPSGNIVEITNVPEAG
jgi:hypothetical protein